MNNKDSNLLIDENEIRAALSFLRIDRDAFGRGVRQRVKHTVARATETGKVNLKDRGGLLRIAGSVLPVNLLGANTTVSQTPYAVVGGFQKAIAYLALPAVSFLMIIVTLVGSYRIRVAHQSQSLPEADLAQMHESITGWWWRYGWIAGIVYALALAAPFIGATTPLLLLLMASAIGTASIVTTLGRAGLVDRNVIGGYCLAMMGILGQVSVGGAMANNTQLLDPHLVTVTFLAGAAFLVLFINPVVTLSRLEAKPKENKQLVFLVSVGFVCIVAFIFLGIIPPTRHVFLVFACGAIAIALSAFMRHKLRNSNPASVTGIVIRGVMFVLLAGVAAFFGQTLWRPIGNAALVEYAESFDPELVGNWNHWQATDRWLLDQGINYDHSAVQARWEEALNDRPYLLNCAVSTGLTFPPNVIETEEFKVRARLLLTTPADTAISSIGIQEYVITILAKEGMLTDQQRDHLANRLMTTWRVLDEGKVRESLVTATTITDLLSLIDRPMAEAERRSDVGRWLGQYQYLGKRPFTRSGGFKRYSTSDHSDLMATENAVRLMQHYGTHDGVDILALQAFLRPASSDRQLMTRAVVRTSIRQRLDQVPGTPGVSLWDYVRLNQSLWFAILLVGLCIYATLGSPRILEKKSD